MPALWDDKLPALPLKHKKNRTTEPIYPLHPVLFDQIVFEYFFCDRNELFKVFFFLVIEERD